ncbi:MAG TPA: diacylglycerol kinase family protein [Vicinamibacterales bacterium]|nr:diacylglycerol kinase family protein [Vicinamibacterales bacterium]
MGLGTLAVILNTSSGSVTPEAIAAIERAIAREGLEAHLHAVAGPQLRETAERAAASGQTLVAAGGDGTVSSVAGVAAAAAATLGIVPLGTLNHFARDAGIPGDIDAAVATLARGRTGTLDAGEISGHVFVNNCSLGFYPRIVRERRMAERRGRSKWTAFAIGMARAWMHYRPITVHLTVDGAPLVRRTPFVFVGNGEYTVEGTQLGSRRSLTGGRLWIYLAPACGRFEMLGLSVRALAGRLRGDVTLEAFAASDVTIEMAPRTVTVAVDGELLALTPPLRCAIRPRALRTLVPAASTGDQEIFCT